jgi:hypothetical protein
MLDTSRRLPVSSLIRGSRIAMTGLPALSRERILRKTAFFPDTSTQRLSGGVEGWAGFVSASFGIIFALLYGSVGWVERIFKWLAAVYNESETQREIISE